MVWQMLSGAGQPAKDVESDDESLVTEVSYQLVDNEELDADSFVHDWQFAKVPQYMDFVLVKSAEKMTKIEPFFARFMTFYYLVLQFVSAKWECAKTKVNNCQCCCKVIAKFTEICKFVSTKLQPVIEYIKILIQSMKAKIDMLVDYLKSLWKRFCKFPVIKKVSSYARSARRFLLRRRKRRVVVAACMMFLLHVPYNMHYNVENNPAITQKNDESDINNTSLFTSLNNLTNNKLIMNNINNLTSADHEDVDNKSSLIMSNKTTNSSILKFLQLEKPILNKQDSVYAPNKTTLDKTTLASASSKARTLLLQLQRAAKSSTEHKNIRTRVPSASDITASLGEDLALKLKNRTRSTYPKRNLALAKRRALSFVQEEYFPTFRNMTRDGDDLVTMHNNHMVNLRKYRTTNYKTSNNMMSTISKKAIENLPSLDSLRLTPRRVSKEGASPAKIGSLKLPRAVTDKLVKLPTSKSLKNLLKFRSEEEKKVAGISSRGILYAQGANQILAGDFKKNSSSFLNKKNKKYEFPVASFGGTYLRNVVKRSIPSIVPAAYSYKPPRASSLDLLAAGSRNVTATINNNYYKKMNKAQGIVVLDDVRGSIKNRAPIQNAMRKLRTSYYSLMKVQRESKTHPFAEVKEYETHEPVAITAPKATPSFVMKNNNLNFNKGRSALIVVEDKEKEFKEATKKWSANYMTDMRSVYKRFFMAMGNENKSTMNVLSRVNIRKSTNVTSTSTNNLMNNSLVSVPKLKKALMNNKSTLQAATYMPRSPLNTTNTSSSISSIMKKSQSKIMTTPRAISRPKFSLRELNYTTLAKSTLKHKDDESLLKTNKITKVSYGNINSMCSSGLLVNKKATNAEIKPGFPMRAPKLITPGYSIIDKRTSSTCDLSRSTSKCWYEKYMSFKKNMKENEDEDSSAKPVFLRNRKSSTEKDTCEKDAIVHSVTGTTMRRDICPEAEDVAKVEEDAPQAMLFPRYDSESLRKLVSMIVESTETTAGARSLVPVLPKELRLFGDFPNLFPNMMNNSNQQTKADPYTKVTPRPSYAVQEIDILQGFRKDVLISLFKQVLRDPKTTKKEVGTLVDVLKDVFDAPTRVELMENFRGICKKALKKAAGTLGLRNAFEKCEAVIF